MATHSLDSFKAPTSNVQGQRGGNGCFVCRLRSKRCLRTENGAGCPACCKLRVECVKKLGSISSLMENSVEGQACRDEIHSAVNSRRYRRDVALLPQTRAFAAKLATNLSFIHSDPSPQQAP
ncbi:uncharacterized protein EI90DRAFT_86126 [Cantharellus anzutake]|uniref:uncharacterized protein n=1 Tax=Cantharellus anzutake TaxID=1750568 RepID=UPI001906350D|nr:uncharacterized protein EI90DRAFT_86126 [Cantharellus anzutake]KAF8336912.1 hypothetical protein EI90DRAFT_86126 [Cantharellus anzutake]